MNWLTIDEEYLDYLRNYEKRIPISNYGENKYKPFFGYLFETNDLYYVTQISHPQLRHNSLKTNLDFKKLYNSQTNKLIAVVNLNYMFPIPKNLYEELEYKNIDNYRSFESDDERSKYISLLRQEINIINNMNIDKAALKLYNLKYTKPDNPVSKRCIDFKDMERLAKEYQEKKEAKFLEDLKQACIEVHEAKNKRNNE